ncbi:MAG: DUF2071 domain-containing protein [Polyangiaceae bacterium]|nr:DUF2071 domain-containing protein [Polyangiaceae bacterium]
MKGARWGWGPPYHHAEMEVRHDKDSGETSYSTVRRSDPSAIPTRYTPGEALTPRSPARLSSSCSSGTTCFPVRVAVDKGHVHHVPYPAQRVEVTEFSEGLTPPRACRRRRACLPSRTSRRAWIVEVFGPRPVAKP